MMVTIAVGLLALYFGAYGMYRLCSKAIMPPPW